jgi:hypothetical protein
MPAIHFNPLQPGALGRVILRRWGDKMIFARPPSVKPKATPARLRQRQRFVEASAYSKGLFNVPARLAPYEAIAEAKQQPLYSVVMTEFLRDPVIKAVVIDDYHGQVGDTLVVRTRMDLPLAKVTLALGGADDAEIETGEAAGRAGEWSYTASRPVPAGTTLALRVTVLDTDGIRIERTMPLMVV